jgi:NADPH:quinone reductase-like Zn-dependent oxidoreductase
VQIARAVGARSIGTARTRAKLDRARELGLDETILVTSAAGTEGGASFADDVRARTGGRGADVIVELVGGAYVAQDLACVAYKGRIVVVGLLAGPHVDFDLGTLMRKRVEVRGTVLRSRPLEEKILAALALDRHLAPLFARGRLKPIVDRVLPLDQAADAHRAMQSNETFGKVVLQV